MEIALSPMEFDEPKAFDNRIAGGIQKYSSLLPEGFGGSSGECPTSSLINFSHPHVIWIHIFRFPLSYFLFLFFLFLPNLPGGNDDRYAATAEGALSSPPQCLLMMLRDSRITPRQSLLMRSWQRCQALSM